MGATLEALHRLQEVETQIAEIQSGIDRKVRACTRQKQKIAEVDARLTAQEQQIRADQMEADRLNLDAKTAEAEIEKYRAALNTSKSQKEYSAVLTQLNTYKADNSKVEDKVLGLFTQIDEKKNQLGAIREERAKEVARLAEFQAEVDDARQRCKDRLAKLMSRRKEAATEVPHKLLDMFTRVAGANEGEAMAAVVRTHPRREEFACEGCNMSITIEQVNAILSRDEPVLCNVCGRILYARTASMATS
ncbi:MAG TPA: C4-type zinc ribbon domain-containing protein [Phycisphaerae bacterium]|nr:C4-type zinc ribbon domain-containing protein [Phycisphaerae bacterium]